MQGHLQPEKQRRRYLKTVALTLLFFETLFFSFSVFREDDMNLLLSLAELLLKDMIVILLDSEFSTV